MILIVAIFALNWVYQVINKPAELVSLLGKASYKGPVSTWEAYESLFRAHSTEVMTPDFLAGMVQVESSGNSFAVSGWRWRWTTDVTRIYSPASSAVGLLQYTDGTFDEAKRFCVHSGKVAYRDRSFSFDSCWFNGLYNRMSPSNSIEMTAGRLQHYVDLITKKYQPGSSQIQKQQLAAIIHLCGLSKGRLFAKKGFLFSSVPRCGTHSPKIYYNKIRKYQKEFQRLS